MGADSSLDTHRSDRKRLAIAGVALSLATLLPVTTSHAQARPARPPLLVVDLLVVADPAAPGHAIVRASSTATGQSTRTLDVLRVAGSCVADRGGMDSLAVVHCDLASGVGLDVEMVTVNWTVYVDRYETAPRGGSVRRGRARLARVRRGWAVVPRCPETFDDANACVAARVWVPSPEIAPTPCRVDLVHTTYEGLRPVVARSEVRTSVGAWGDAGREEGWLSTAPAAWTLAAARSDLAGARESRVGRRTVIMADGEGGGTLSYFFDALGRTERVTWDPEADSSDYEYRYRYECAP